MANARYMVLKLDYSYCYYEGDPPDIRMLGTVQAGSQTSAETLCLNDPKLLYYTTVIEIPTDM